VNPKEVYLVGTPEGAKKNEWEFLSASKVAAEIHQIENPSHTAKKTVRLDNKRKRK
jgi:hypothetical protein